jgi:hypothetical protein
MDLEKLSKQVKEYLEKYLDYFENGRLTDERLFLPETGETYPIHFESNFPFLQHEIIDFHKKSFDNIVSQIPFLSRQDLIEEYLSIEDLLLVDIGCFGSDVSLFTGFSNDSSHVLLSNPDMISFYKSFANILGNNFPDFKERIGEDRDIRDVLKEQDISNVSFFENVMTLEEMNRLSEVHFPKPVVFYSFHTPTMPEEMTSKIAEVVSKQKNAYMVLVPMLNTNINAYQSDPLIKKVNAIWSKIRTSYMQKREMNNKAGNPFSSPEARLFNTMSLYYSLQSASVANAKIYRWFGKQKEDSFKFPSYVVKSDLPKISSV